MNSTTDILRGELERLFELEDMKQLSADLLGLDPEDVGGTSGKGAFARALVERCQGDNALEALGDAIVISAQGKDATGRIDEAFKDDVGVELPLGSELAGLRILKQVAAAGIGVVYLAERKGTDGQAERAAIKVIKHGYSRDHGAVRRFLTVCRAHMTISHPGIAEVLAVGELSDGRPWVATRFIDGQTLAARIARMGPMHFNEARPVVRGILSALDALHERGIVHGDLKAENVFLVRDSREDGSRSDARGVLIDGGLDRLLGRHDSGDAASTSLFTVFGTAKAIDPELARGGRPTPGTDLYALATLLYEVVAGRPPFTGKTAMDVVAQHLITEAAPPSQHAPRGWIPKELDEILTRALAKEPKDRFESAAQLLEALESVGRAARESRTGVKQDLDQAAFAAAADALRSAPEDEEKAIALERVAEPARAWSELIEVVSEAAEVVQDVEAKKALLFRIARVQEHETADRDGAEATYAKILAADPSDEIAQIGLEELKRASGKAEELVELLLEKAEREEVPAARAAILREVAGLYEEKLQSEDSAFAAWVQALADEPSDGRTVREIERLANTAARWNEAISTLNEAADELDDPQDAARLFSLMGRWYADHLQRPDFALQCYNQALTKDPGHDAAFDGTIALYRKSESWQELLTVLLRRAEVTTNPARARDFRADAAEVVLKKINDPMRAISLFEEVVADDPTHPKAAEALEVMHTDRGNWKALANLLEARSRNERGDPKVATLARIGELFEDRLDDYDKAAVSYEAVLAHDPHNITALKGLERIYARTNKYGELLSNLETQHELAPTPRQRIALLERIGAIQEEEFVDHEKAAEAFAKIVEVEPGHDAANTALERLYRHIQRFDALADTLDRHAKGSTDDARKVTLLLAAVKVLMVDVGAPERALAVCDRILAIDQEQPEALELVARLRATTGDAAAAIDAVDRLAEAEKEPSKKCDLCVRAGRLLEDKGDKDGAIDRYRRALDANAKSADALTSLRAIYASRGDAHGTVDLLQREIDVTDGEITQAKLYLEMGLLLRDRLDEEDRARDAFVKALDLDSTCTPAARQLGDMAFLAQNWSEAVRYLTPVIGRTTEMAVSEARDVCVKCGDAHRHLGELDKAQRAYLNAKAFAPDDKEVAERVAEVTFEAGAADEAAELYRDMVHRFRDQMTVGERGRMLCRLGESLRRAGDLNEAVPFLNEAAELIPEDDAPITALRQVYADQGKWELVVRTLRRRMEHAGDDERFTLLVEAGDVLLEKMGDRSKASKSYVAGLEIRPDDRNVLTKLMGVYSESKDWSRLVEVILRIADLVDEPKQLAKYYNTAAAISHRELGRLDEASDYYEQALDNEPSMGNAFEGLVDCLSQRQDYDALAAAYRAHLKRLGEGAPPERRANLWDSLGEILHHRLGRLSEAVDAFEHGQELEPESRRRVEQLAAIYAADPKRYFTKAVHAHTVLLHRSPYRAESYQALRALYTDMKKADESWCICQALTVLNMAEPDEAAFFKKHRSRTPAAAQEFFTEEIWFSNIIHPDQDPLLTGIFACITPAVVATRAQPLSTFALKETDARNPEVDPAAMAQTLHYAAGVAQIQLPDVYYRPEDMGGLSFVYANPPAIGLGQGALAGGPSQALAFVAGRHLSYFRAGHYLRYLIPTGSGLRAWLLAAIKIAQPNFPVPADLATPVAEHLGALKQHLIAQAQDELQSLVGKLLTASPSLDMKKWVAAIDLTADRVGTVLANDLEIATAVVRASPDDAAGISQKERLKELYLYSVSEEYLQLRHKLGIAIGE